MNETELDALKRDLGSIAWADTPGLLRQKSRDFYWYSPVLKEQLDKAEAELVVIPKTEAELIDVLRIAHKHTVPVTARGGGTGNYGQCMPLSGGIVLDMTRMNRVLSVAPGKVVAEAGALLSDIDAEAQKTGQELRFHPSTNQISTVAGFVSGGLGGVGSITWGTLRELGNILRLRVVTMEAEPRVLELTGYDVLKVSHAYGTNGIITEVELPLAPAYEWIDMIVGYDDFMDAARFADEAAHSVGILLKELGVVEAPAPFAYFTRHRPFLKEGQSVVLLMVAPQSAGAIEALVQRMQGEIRFRSDRDRSERTLPHVYELSWNHTTLRALKIDKDITYLQVLYPGPDHMEQIARLAELTDGELINHLELIKFDGKVQYTALPMLRYTTPARLDELVRLFEANGCAIFNPHRYTLEEGGMKQTDAVQLDFKKETDPQGLLNPGKMIGWDNPDHDYSEGHIYMFSGLSRMEA